MLTPSIGARLYDLVGGAAAVLVLPAGARAFKREWAAVVPRGARVFVCHDADDDGDQGAEKAARILGGHTVRLRPPLEGGDWCDWPGNRDEFVALARRVQEMPRYEFASYREFATATTRSPNCCSANLASPSSPSAPC
jgi:hypothetical protein